MNQNHRLTGCEHGQELDGIVQYQRNLDRIEVFVDEAAYTRAFSAGNCIRCKVDTMCIDEQSEVQEYAIVYKDDSGFVTRHDDTPLLMVFYRGIDESQFRKWVAVANSQMSVERIFWEFITEDEEQNGVPKEVDDIKAWYERFHAYVSHLDGLTWSERNRVITAYEGMVMVWLATSQR